MLMRTLVAEGEDAEAETFCQTAIGEHPVVAVDLYTIRGWMRVNQKNYEGAKSDFQSAISLRPNDAQAHLFLSVVLNVLKDSKGAAAELEKARQLSPDVQQLQAELGRQGRAGAAGSGAGGAAATTEPR
jgi:Flp pilus assembly protein TadD